MQHVLHIKGPDLGLRSYLIPLNNNSVTGSRWLFYFIKISNFNFPSNETNIMQHSSALCLCNGNNGKYNLYHQDMLRNYSLRFVPTTAQKNRHLDPKTPWK